MMEKIEKPKVFISYAWASQEYEEKVLSFASQLVHDGIDVVIDKWDLVAGNDTYAFMEKCVTDSSITNVLILLDPVYAKKANERVGGVGAEAQIISPEIYKKTEQVKFIPIVMQMDENNHICKPTYLDGRLHFDLSNPEHYDFEYRKLVKRLFGEEIYPKPEMGMRPNWVGEPLTSTPIIPLQYDSLKQETNAAIKRERFSTYLNLIKDSFANFLKDPSAEPTDARESVELYDSTETMRNQYLQLLQCCPYVAESNKIIAGFLEEIEANASYRTSSFKDEIVAIRRHEMFIYTIAYHLQKSNHQAVGYLLERTYFDQNRLRKDNGATDYSMFYSGHVQQKLDRAVCIINQRKYTAGTVQHWIDTIARDFCTREQFVLADLICCNYSIYGKNRRSGQLWFPITYIYDDEHNSIIGKMARRLISREYTESILPIFGYSAIEAFRSTLKEEGTARKEYLRYPERFEHASLLCDYIEVEKIATLP